MSNPIPARIFDFLKDYPPFSFMPPNALQEAAAKAEVRYLEPGAILFRQGEKPGNHIFIVREGAIHLMLDEALIEACDEGDVFGFRPLLDQSDYALSALAAEESLVYAIPVDPIREEFSHNPRITFYLASNFAAGLRHQYTAGQQGKLFLEKEDHINERIPLLEIQPIQISKAPVTCTPDTLIREAAAIMSEKEVGSIIVVDSGFRPVGIATDVDLRKQVATGQTAIDQPIRGIMSSPVLAIAPHATVADVQIRMLREKKHHLCVTADGTPDSPVQGVVSEHDLLVLQGNNPALLIREADRAPDGLHLRALRDRAEELLRKYLYQEVSISFISTVLTEINDALIRRAIHLALSQMGPAPTAFCWLALGSEGREEQLLRTDQDNALVFEEVSPDQLPEVRTWFLNLAKSVTATLHTAGFEYCPADMMASNPAWRLSLLEWKSQFSQWIRQPTPQAIMHGTIFFDYRPVFGESSLSEALTAHIFEELDNREIFLSLLAQNALQNPPPLSFFRNFMVEKGGEHKDEFDIKKRAMMPLTDAARTLVLEARIPTINNTFRRFERLAALEPQNAELYQQAADAYEILMRFRTLQGLKNGDSGRFFNPATLTKMERIQLRNCFQPIRDLQTLLTTRFRLNLLPA